jgi:integrase
MRENRVRRRDAPGDWITMSRRDPPSHSSGKPPGSMEAPARWSSRSAHRAAHSAESRRADGAVGLGPYVQDHLARKRASRTCSVRWLQCVEGHLAAAVAVLGTDTPVAAVEARCIEQVVADLLERPNGRGGTLSPSTVAHHLNSLSHLFRRAERDGLVECNPVARLLDRPRPQATPTPWLEVPEVTDILRAARDRAPRRQDLAIPFLFELVAVFAYTGIRKSEGLGVTVEDLCLERGVLIIRPNRWRDLKTGESDRVVPLFSELRAILDTYLTGPRAPTGDLLFPSPFGATERPLTNLRRSFGPLPMPVRLAEVAGGTPPNLGTRILRHSYCAARLQTLDCGSPISPYTVARELGHRDLSMVLRIYGHLGKIRCRHDEVRFLGTHEVRRADGLAGCRPVLDRVRRPIFLPGCRRRFTSGPSSRRDDKHRQGGPPFSGG